MIDEYRIEDAIARAARPAPTPAEEPDLRALMALPEGRRFMYRLLSAAGCFRSSFAVDPHQTAFNEGQRNIGLWAMGLLRSDEYAQMMKEQEDGPRERNPRKR